MADPSLAPELLDAVARLIVPDLRDDRPGSWDEARELARPRAEGGLGLGGFLTFGGDRETLPVRIASVREAAGDRELLFFSDLERGAGQQVRGFTLLPHLMALGAADDESLCEAAGELTAREAIEAGIDCAFAPCIDLNTDPENPIINVRAFGDDPQVVARLSAAWVRGCRRGGALSCAKHYPGHGDVTVDSHTALPHLGASLETLEARELVPFRALSAAGVDTVMIGHLACPALTGARAGDPVPVTISPRAMGYLRETMGYEGLIVTDALFMGGLTAHLDELDASVLSLKAGCDVLLCPSDARALFDRLVEALQAGAISEERVWDAHRRFEAAIAARRRGGDRARKEVSSSTQGETAGCSGEALAERIATAGIAALRGDSPPALREADRPACVLISGDPGAPLPALAAEVEDQVPWVRLLPVGIDSPGTRLDEVLEAVRQASDEGQEVAVAVASRPRADKGSAGIPPTLERFLGAVIEAAPGATVIALGAPYLLRGVHEAGTGFRAAAFSDEPPSQRAVATLLARGGRPTGVLPIRWPGAFAGAL